MIIENPNISGCIITDDNIEVVKAVDSIYSSCSEVIVVNTVKTKKVNELLRNYTKVKMHYFKWVDDYSKARNYGLKKCKGEWVLVIDSDEVLNKPIERLDNKYLCYQCRQMNGTYGIYHNRLFQNNKGIYFKNVVHETIDHHLHPSNCIEDPNIIMIHSGFQISAEDMEKKMQRNYKLMFKDTGNVVRNLHLGNYFFTYEEDYIKAMEYYDLAMKDKLTDSFYAIIQNNIHACRFMLKYPLDKLIESLKRSLVYEPFQIYARVNVIEHLLSCINQDNSFGFLKDIKAQLQKVDLISRDKLSNLMLPDLEVDESYINSKYEQLKQWDNTIERIAI